MDVDTNATGTWLSQRVGRATNTNNATNLTQTVVESGLGDRKQLSKGQSDCVSRHTRVQPGKSTDARLPRRVPVQRAHNAMFSLFRIKRPSSRIGAPKKLAPRPRIESGQYDPPSLEGYAVQELEIGRFARTVQSGAPTPEPLRMLGERIR